MTISGDFAGHVACITGGTRGICAATARALAVAFLASVCAAYVTGAVLQVSGGLYM